MNLINCIDEINSERIRNLFAGLYGTQDSVIEKQQQRYIQAVKAFHEHFPNRAEVKIYSAPGRTEIGGNHTDHQRGMVLAGAVNLDVIAVVAFHDEGVVRVKSEGYDLSEINLDDLTSSSNDDGTAALVKGVIAKFSEKKVLVGGFDMYTTSDVICGGGISSSAAFETLIGTVVNQKYNNGECTAFEIAKYGWFAENVYFGKKCGLLDQTVSSYGGLVSINFEDEGNPIIEKIDFDFEKFGYTLCITDTKSSHENLTDDYVAIREEMKQIAKHFGCDVLNTVNETDFYDNIKELRSKYGDRAVLRSIHFFDETKRAKEETESLKRKDINRFLALVNESGDSSWKLLQNNYCITTPHNQEIPLAITLTKKVLCGDGAVRVHGGGFAGTVQAFVPIAKVAEYRETMEKVFGEGSVYVLRIRPVGGIQII